MKAPYAHHLSAAVLVSLGLLLPQTASAQGGTTIPSGNSAISQYLESVPTAAGGQPTTSVRRSHHSHGSGSHPGSSAGGGSGGTGSSGGGYGGGGGSAPAAGGGNGAAAGAGGSGAPAGGGGGADAGGSVGRSTSHALASHGAIGAEDAAFARATAPASTTRGLDSTGSPTSATSAILKSLTGSSSGGGLGPFLPAILVFVALAGGVLSMLRRRTRRTTS